MASTHRDKQQDESNRTGRWASLQLVAVQLNRPWAALFYVVL